jgi:hypothetical protein
MPDFAAHLAAGPLAPLSEEAGHSALTPPWVFGVTGFGILVGLLILTMMINVKR